MNKNYNELKRNTIIIAIANMGSKIIAFILAPLYSYFMTVAQYGIMDLINSTMGLVLPLLCLDIYEATFRYSNDKKYDKKKVFSSSFVISLPGILVCFMIPFFTFRFDFSQQYIIIVCICAILGSINFIMAQYLRGSDKMFLFALSGVVSSVSLLFSNCVFMVLLNQGLYGWLLSFLISKIVETIYLGIACKITKNFSVHAIDRKYMKEFIKFCLPLLPTATMWWIMDLSDRYMLTFFMGTTATGIYSVANKLPNILSIFENIFYQAWQTTAINSIDNNDRDRLYSDVFNNYLSVMVVGLLGILVITKPMILVLFAEEYASAWLYVPLLILSVVLHALNGNLGSLYSVFKDTKGALYSTLIGAVTNIILNIIFIPVLGIMGAALNTLLGYFVTIVYRWFDTKKFANITLNIRELYIYVLLVGIQLFLYYISGIWSYIVRCIILIVLLISKRNLFLKMLKK
ncbi:oligosaccharide flippase family protein [Clostridium diolis]|uniref:Flippase n=1 Tax=Clostridium diolis TaxID=223919 RepID=A0AAV3VVL3_9CLOT|nr:oligosaccharide flippase family protein [Clostridium diolis]QES72337.1 oligosaccharide flippase family protein [Clostridium diolis]GEA30035.1 flippase [Clostridium diolis]